MIRDSSPSWRSTNSRRGFSRGRRRCPMSWPNPPSNLISRLSVRALIRPRRSTNPGKQSRGPHPIALSDLSKGLSRPPGRPSHRARANSRAMPSLPGLAWSTRSLRAMIPSGGRAGFRRQEEAHRRSLDPSSATIPRILLVPGRVPWNNQPGTPGVGRAVGGGRPSLCEPRRPGRSPSMRSGMGRSGRAPGVSGRSSPSSRRRSCSRRRRSGSSSRGGRLARDPSRARVDGRR